MRPIRLIGITGKARSGKSTAANLLVDRGFMEYSMAEPIKLGLRSMFGFGQRQLFGDLKETVIPAFGKSPRQMMQTLGTEWGRELVHEDIWLRCADQFITEARLKHGHRLPGVVIPDIRFMNEADWLRRNGGQLIHIDRPDCEQIQAHKSEDGVDYVEGLDVRIINDADVSHLRHQVAEIVFGVAPPPKVQEPWGGLK